MENILQKVQSHVEALGLVIEEDYVGDAPGYWMIDPVTGEGPWSDDNFSTSLLEVAGKLRAIEHERKFLTLRGK